MKKNKKKYFNKLSKRAISLLLCFAMFTDSFGNIGIMAINKLFDNILANAASVSLDQVISGNEPSDITYHDGSTTKIEAITIKNSAELLWLAQQGAENYYDAVITISPDLGSPFSNEIVDFPGLGSDTAPFEGTFQITHGTTFYLYSDHALFNYISDKAKIHELDAPDLPAIIAINRVSDSDSVAPSLLAENIVHDDSSNDNILFDKLIFRAEYGQGLDELETKPFGGIIGTVGDNCKVNINAVIKNKIEISSENSVGLACCELGEGAELVFSYESESTVNNFPVTSENGNAGGLVGKMNAGSKLTVENDFSFTGNVTAENGDAGGLVGFMNENSLLTISSGGSTEYSGEIKAGNNAGGLVGEMHSGASLELSGNYTFSGIASATAEDSSAGGLIGSTFDGMPNISGKTVVSGTVAAANAGGIAGTAIYSSERIFDVTCENETGLSIDNVSISGTNCGGSFGTLENNVSSGKIKILGKSVSSQIDNDAESCENCGGLIGKYTADALERKLEIHDIDVTINGNNKEIVSFGGLIGLLDGGESGEYVELSGDEITVNTSNIINTKTTNYGGIVGNASDNGNFIDVNCTALTVSTDSEGYNGASSGGLVGTMKNGVMRLNGAVDLSGSIPVGAGPGQGIVMGYRANTLVYADSSFSITRCADTGNRDDIGQWGEIVRYSNVGGSNTIAYNSDAHTVTVKKHTDLTTAASKEDFSRLALYIQLNTEGNIGALRFEDSGITSGDLLSSNIVIDGDIDLAGTGITGLTRDDGSNNVFTGQIDGRDHSVSLAVGDTSTGFRGVICTHSHCGLIAKSGDGALIKNLTIGGYMNVYSASITELGSDGKKTDYGARIGGLIAQHTGSGKGDGNALKISNVKAFETIKIFGHDHGRNRAGGLIGDVAGGRVDLGATGNDSSKCVIGCKIDNADHDVTTTTSFGGLIAQSDNAVININNVQFSGSGNDQGFKIEMHNADQGNVGGILGYEWLNTQTFINKLVIGSDENQAEFKQSGTSPKIGALINKASGFIQVNDLDIKNLKIETANDPSSFGMIVNDGTELYLEVTDTGYYDIGSLTCNINSPNVYDEFVAYTNRSDTGSNGSGVVSLPTKDRNGVDSSNIFNNSISGYTEKVNQNTRYYYNIDTIRSENGPDNGKQLLLWSLYHYSSVCNELFAEHLNEDFKANKINGKCDLTGLSYYPINVPENSGITIADGTEIIFDSKELTFNSVSDAAIKRNQPNQQNQLYMMQRGLFRDMESSSKDDIRKLTIEGSLTLSGPISKVEGFTSGALFCGRVMGSKPDNETSDNSADIKCNADSSIILKDLYVRGYSGNGDDVAPLLIGKVEQYVDINLVGVKTDSTKNYSLPSEQGYAASSLIGEVGMIDGQSVNISFSKIALDSRKTSDALPDGYYGTEKSIFSRAVLLESFSFADDSGSTGSYDFKVEEDWTNKEPPFTAKHEVTYGYEITHSVEFAGEQDCYLKSSYLVSPDLVNGTTHEYDFESDKYLPYVYHSPATDNGSNQYTVEKKYHELRINSAATNFSGGCGTYGDPYRIAGNDGADQLVTLSNILMNYKFSAGYEVYYPKSGENSDPDCRISESVHKKYRYESGAFYRVKDDDSIDNNDYVTVDTMFNYLRDAYYIIENDIEVGNNFKGLGMESAPYQIFRGIIVGKKKANNDYPTLTMKGDKPLVNISGGCVVKDLNIKYTEDINIEENNGGAFVPTNVPDINIGCNYFGGVIGQVLAGDNIIDNVNVTFDKKIVLTGEKKYLVPVGAYVGVVRNGGLILRNMSGKNVIVPGNIKIYKDETEEYDFSNMDDTNYLYINPYIGRVLDGFVVTDDEGGFGDSTINNGTKNYSIVKLKKNVNNNEKLYLTLLSNNVLSGLPKNNGGTGDTGAGDFTWSNIQVPNAQSLFVLSAIVSSGAAAYQPNRGSSRNPKGNSTFHYFTDTSYCLGSTHLANYDKVQNLTDITYDDFVTAKNDVRGKRKTSDEYEVSKAIPYIIKYYTKNQPTKNASGTDILDEYPARIICSSNTRYSITLTDETKTTYKMPNGFRGINAMYNNTSYSTNPDRQVINMFGFNGKGNTVEMTMNIMSYGKNDPYNPFGVGLITRFQQNTSGESSDELKNALIINDFSSISAENMEKYKGTYAVENLPIKGELSYSVPEENGEAVTREFVEKNGKNIIVGQSVCVGGFAGRNYDSNSKTLYYWFDNVTVDANISGGYSSGALIGAVGNFENGTMGFDGQGKDGSGAISSAKVQTIVANNIIADKINVSAVKYAGGLFGIVNKSDNGIFIDCNDTKDEHPIKIKNVIAYMNENRCGGLIGSTSQKVNVKNSVITNYNTAAKGLIGEEKEDTFESTVYAGGIAGYAGGATTINNVSVRNLDVNVRSKVSDCSAGGMIGYSNSSANFAGCEVDSSKIYVKSKGANSNVGGLCGKLSAASTLENSVVKNTEIKTSPYEASGYAIRIGGMIGHVPDYKDITGFNLLLFDNDFIVETIPVSNATAGNWIGRADKSLIQLTAISKQGTKDYLEKDLSGKLNDNNYLIYADYEGTALNADANKENAQAPYVHVNPLSEAFTALPKMDDTEGYEKVTGNGVKFGTGEYANYAITKKIIDEATDATADNTDYSKIVKTKNGVKTLDIDSEFTFEYGSSFNGQNANVISFNTQIQNDNAKFDNMQLPEAVNDFPVLLIQNNDADALNQLINDYISVLINEKNFSISELAVKTYKLDNNKWTTNNIKNSLRVSNGRIYSVPGQYDNEKGQFTLIRAAFDSPVKDSSDKLYLYIPVIVKKVLQFKVTTKIVSDTKYLASEYTQGRVVENNGVPVTSLITFSYCNRTYQEWLEAINAGESYFWNFDKAIMFQHDVGQQHLPNGEKQALITLVDKNNKDKAYYGTLADEGVFDTNNGKVDFMKLREDTGKANSADEKKFKPVTLAQLICEQLDLEAVTAGETDAAFVLIPEDEVDHEGTDERFTPTIMAYLNGNMSYFRPYSADDEALEPQPPKYALRIKGSYSPTAVKNITEQYYLTLKTDKSIQDLFYVKVHYVSMTLNGGNMATNNITEDGEYDDLVLANFFDQQNFIIKTSGNEEIQGSSSEIGVEMSVDLKFNTKNSSAFASYGSVIGLDQGFIISYVKYLKTESGEYRKNPQDILGGTKLQGVYEVSAAGEVVGRADINEYIDDSCNEYLLKYNGTGDLKSLLTNDSNVEKALNMKAKFSIMLTDFDESMISLQFPSHQTGDNNDQSGLVVCGKSNVAYDESKLQNSIVSTGNPQEDSINMRYYTSFSESASLSYDAVEEDAGDSLGKISQLGINANELFEKNSVRINALGIYNASVLAEEPAATELLLDFTLKRKMTNLNKYDTDYKPDIKDHLRNFKLYINGKEYSGTYKDNVYSVIVDDWRVISNDSGSVKISTTFDVLTGKEFEKKGYLYSNYDLILTAKLKGSDGEITGSFKQDHIVYTNSRICTDILQN